MLWYGYLTAFEYDHGKCHLYYTYDYTKAYTRMYVIYMYNYMYNICAGPGGARRRREDAR